MRDDGNDRRNGRGDRDRLSWKEIDQLRDKSRTRDRDPMQKQSSPAAMAAQKSYRAALERAFEAGKLGELARTLAGAETRRVEPPGPDGAPRGEPRPAPEAEQRAPDGAANNATPPQGGAATAAGADGPGAPGAAPAAANGAAAPAAAGPAPLPAAVPAAPKDPDRENRMKMIVRIKEAEGREPISRAIDGFLARYGKLPDDYEVLTKALSHRNDDRVRVVLDQLTAMLGREKPRRGRGLSAQLRLLEDTHLDAEIRRAAAEVRARL